MRVGHTYDIAILEATTLATTAASTCPAAVATPSAACSSPFATLAASRSRIAAPAQLRRLPRWTPCKHDAPIHPHVEWERGAVISGEYDVRGQPEVSLHLVD